MFKSFALYIGHFTVLIGNTKTIGYYYGIIMINKLILYKLTKNYKSLQKSKISMKRKNLIFLSVICVVSLF